MALDMSWCCRLHSRCLRTLRLDSKGPRGMLCLCPLPWPVALIRLPRCSPCHDVCKRRCQLICLPTAPTNRRARVFLAIHSKAKRIIDESSTQCAFGTARPPSPDESCLMQGHQLLSLQRPRKLPMFPEQTASWLPLLSPSWKLPVCGQNYEHVSICQPCTEPRATSKKQRA